MAMEARGIQELITRYEIPNKVEILLMLGEISYIVQQFTIPDCWEVQYMGITAKQSRMQYTACLQPILPKRPVHNPTSSRFGFQARFRVRSFNREIV